MCIINPPHKSPPLFPLVLEPIVVSINCTTYHYNINSAPFVFKEEFSSQMIPKKNDR